MDLTIHKWAYPAQTDHMGPFAQMGIMGNLQPTHPSYTLRAIFQFLLDSTRKHSKHQTNIPHKQRHVHNSPHKVRIELGMHLIDDLLQRPLQREGNMVV